MIYEWITFAEAQMIIRETRVMEKRNIYSHRPVIKMTLDLTHYTPIHTGMLKKFPDKLESLLPGLKKHGCSRGKPGGFSERLREGTYLGHVIEHVALELQCLAGNNVNYGTTRGSDVENIYYVVFEYEVSEVGKKAAECAVNLARDVLKDGEVDVPSIVSNLKNIKDKCAPGPSTAAIIAGCQKRGIPTLLLNEPSFWQMGYGSKQQRIEATITGKTSCVGVDLACDKNLTNKFLGESGIPVPRGEIVYSPDEAVSLWQNIKAPVVVKPNFGNQGKALFLNLDSEAQVRAAFTLALQFGPEVLVEKYIPGKQYRLLVIDGKVVAATERIPVVVTGDGKSTIKELVAQVNEHPLRGENHEAVLTKIKIDTSAIFSLSKQGYTPEDIPTKGETVMVRENANLSSGATAVDVTLKVHPYNKEIAQNAAEIVGLDVAGIDIVTDDISKPMINGAVIEVNASPGLRMHLYPGEGEPQPVGDYLVDYLFPQESDGRIPIVSITGTNGKTTTTRLISHILSHEGHKVGMTTTDGIFAGDKMILSGDTTGPESARLILKNPHVTAAVLETARGGIIRQGLGYDLADVAVVTNISEDHLGQNEVHSLEDLAHVKSLVAEAVCDQGTVVLNADDPHVVKMKSKVKGKVIFFSTADSIVLRRHLGIGGTGVFVKNGWITVATGIETTKIIKVTDIPCTMGGKLMHNVQNVLAAVAVGLAFDVSVPILTKALINFTSDKNPGRNELYTIDDTGVLVDYGHNKASYVSMLNFAQQLKPRRIIGVIGVPGDRRDLDIIQVGEIAGKGFEQIYIKEDEDLRGRKPGEVAELLKKGAIFGGMKENQIVTFLSETEAVEAALEGLEQGDLLIIFYEKHASVHNIVEHFKEKALCDNTTLVQAE